MTSLARFLRSISELPHDHWNRLELGFTTSTSCKTLISTLVVGANVLALLATLIALRAALSTSCLESNQAFAVSRVIPAHDLAKIVLGSICGFVHLAQAATALEGIVDSR